MERDDIEGGRAQSSPDGLVLAYPTRIIQLLDGGPKGGNVAGVSVCPTEEQLLIYGPFL